MEELDEGRHQNARPAYFVVAWADKQVTTTSGGKPATTTHPSTPAAATVADQLRAKLKAGYKPAPGAIKPVIKALRNAVGWYEVVNAFSDDELPEVYAAIAADTPKPMMREVCAAFRRRPSDAALPYLLKLTKDPTGDDIQQLVKAFEFAAKAPGVAAWLQRSLAASVAKLPNERARTVLGRMLARLARGPKLAPTAPAPAAKGSDEADLLAAIAAAPADDGPRQVYADWLIDRGNHWGEVITLALRVARMPDDAKQTEAYVALRRLEAKHAKQFLEPIRPFIRTWQFERGMISYVTCDAQLFAQAGASIADRAPRGVLNLTGLKPKGLAALVASPLGRAEREPVIEPARRCRDRAAGRLAFDRGRRGARRRAQRVRRRRLSGDRRVAASPVARVVAVDRLLELAAVQRRRARSVAAVEAAAEATRARDRRHRRRRRRGVGGDEAAAQDHRAAGRSVRRRRCARDRVVEGARRGQAFPRQLSHAAHRSGRARVARLADRSVGIAAARLAGAVGGGSRTHRGMR